MRAPPEEVEEGRRPFFRRSEKPALQSRSARGRKGGLAGWPGKPNSHLEVRQRAGHPRVSPEIRKLRRKDSITIFAHLEEGEKQNNHLAEDSVNIVEGLIRTLKGSTKSNLRTEIGPSHPLIPWISEHAAQLRNRFIVGADGIRLPRTLEHGYGQKPQRKCKTKKWTNRERSRTARRKTRKPGRKRSSFKRNREDAGCRPLPFGSLDTLPCCVDMH